MNKPVVKTPLVKLIPLLVRGVAPAAAITFGLLPATTVSAPGDLDPSFGDFGRVAPVMDFSGPAWSAQAVGTDDTLIAGGDYCGYYCAYYGLPEFSDFLGELSGDGSPVASFVPAQLHETEIFDTAVLADGSIIAVGRSLAAQRSKLTVVKMSSSGALDTSFGTDGIFRLDARDGDHQGSSVTVDSFGRIVVVGPQFNPQELIAVRLHPNGALDTAFGTSGVYTGPVIDYVTNGMGVLATGSGYRVTDSDCTVIGLTAAGTLDSTFGTAGVANRPPSGQTRYCTSLATQPDGKLLVAGSDGTHAYAARLLANGAGDTTFSSSAIVAGMSSATALAVAGDGSGTIVVAGTDLNGTPDAVVMRVQASGLLDTTFGRAGTTLIDLPSEEGTFPVVLNLLWRSDGSVIAAGGDAVANQPFVARLLGAGGADVAGVIGAPQPALTTNEQSNEIIVKVRRTGGDAGTVSVAYKTIPIDGTTSRATSGKDFTPVAGRLTWFDGDIADQEIHVPILPDSTTEESEYFRVQLSDPAGGAGLGTRDATVEIQPDGSPHGQFSVTVDTPAVSEGTPAQVEVSRDYYTSGAVSVTVTPVGGTAAAGSDFDPTPVTLSWADGEGGPKTVTIGLLVDGMAEPAEKFSVELSNPTGGALIGPRSTGNVSINASAGGGGGGGGGYGGGGAFGGLGLLLLAAAKLLQSAWASVRKRLPYGA